jgi:hypothetical protein
MMAWAEDRAPWRHDPSADPGAKTEGGRHDAALSLPFGIGTKAANRPLLIPCTLYLISQPRFHHFTLNHYTGVGAKSIPVAAGSPWENGYIESFHNRLRDKFLERVEFDTVADARAKASWFRREYNTVRPHSSLGYATPREYSAACDAKEEKKQKITR